MRKLFLFSSQIYKSNQYTNLKQKTRTQVTSIQHKCSQQTECTTTRSKRIKGSKERYLLEQKQYLLGPKHTQKYLLGQKHNLQIFGVEIPFIKLQQFTAVPGHLFSWT